MERLKYEKIQETLRDLSMSVNERIVRERIDRKIDRERLIS